MKTVYLLIVLCLMVITFGCSTISVNYDFDSKADFTSLKTFSFLPVPEKANINTLNVKRIHDAVRNQLESKGFKAMTDNPDFLIAMHLTKKKKKLVVSDYNYNYSGYSRTQGTYWRTGITREFEYEEGTFVLDFVDTQSKELIWRGVARGEIRDDLSPEKRIKRINEGAQKILSNFPPAR